MCTCVEYIRERAFVIADQLGGTLQLYRLTTPEKNLVFCSCQVSLLNR
jgi:hypothetical protein